MMSEGWKARIGSGEVNRNATVFEKRDIIRISRTRDLNLFIYRTAQIQSERQPQDHLITVPTFPNVRYG